MGEKSIFASATIEAFSPARMPGIEEIRLVDRQHEMRARWIYPALALFALACASLVINRMGRELPRIRLKNGNELAVLDVSLEPKTSKLGHLPATLMVRFLPESWSENLFENPEPRFLQITVVERNPMEILPTFRDASIKFPEGWFATGQMQTTRSNTVRIRFNNYPRTEEQLEVRLSNTDEVISLAVPNPFPSRPKVWAALPLPQTNTQPHTSFVLRKGTHPDYPLSLTSSGVGIDTRKWTHLHVELQDPTGNWTTAPARGHQIGRPDSGLSGECYQMTVRMSEYISAGMVTLPEKGVARALIPELRASELGVKQVFLLGEGKYRTHGNVIYSEGPVTNGAPTLIFVNGASAMEVSCTKPALLIVYMPIESMAIHGRLRERRGKARDGAVFQSRRPLMVNDAPSRVAAGLFPLDLRTEQFQLEAEVIIRHPPVRFKVGAKEFTVNSGPGM